MKRKFRLHLFVMKGSSELVVREPPKMEEVTADNMVELVLKFTMMITKLEREFHEEDLKVKADDDIPF